MRIDKGIVDFFVVVVVTVRWPRDRRRFGCCVSAEAGVEQWNTVVLLVVLPRVTADCCNAMLLSY